MAPPAVAGRCPIGETARRGEGGAANKLADGVAAN